VAFFISSARWPRTLGSMSQLRRDAVILACAIAFAWFATPWARLGWSTIFVPESHSTTVARIFLSDWTFEFLWGAAFGVLLTRSLRSRGAFWWSLSLGVGLGLSHFALSRWHLRLDMPAYFYVWAYGQYLMPVIGAVAASWWVTKCWPMRRSTAPNAA